MSAALAATFKSRAVALLESLPQHQQLLLCAMVLRGRKSSGGGGCTLADLHASYKRLCSSQKLPALPVGEILPLCNNIAACDGLLKAMLIGLVTRAATLSTSSTPQS